MFGRKEHLGGSCRNRGPRAKCTSSTEPKGPLSPCNTSYGRSEGLHQCLRASKSMRAFCKCDLMVEQLAEGRAVLIPAALWSPGGHFPVVCWSMILGLQSSMSSAHVVYCRVAPMPFMIEWVHLHSKGMSITKH